MMKIKKKNILMLPLMALAIGFTASCSKMDVGYLRTEGASFTPDSLNVFHNIDPNQRAGNRQFAVRFHTHSGCSRYQSC